MRYDLATIRELLEAAFSDEDLNNFCFDHFSSVYEQFTGVQTKSSRVRMLITYAEKNSNLDDLLARIKQVNSHKYAEFESRLKVNSVDLKQREKKLAVSLGKLPSTNPELFGREKELKMLDDAWSDPKINIVSLVAWGGVGKTALVNTWLRLMEQENFRGAERVFGWSFYSQGASENKQASADIFIATALRWFGDPEPEKGTPWEMGERLAEYVKRQKTLLILDGIEPLQNPFREQEGKIKDPGLATLVRELANHNHGLCIITTRLEVDDIKDFIGTTVENKHLEHLSENAGMELLKHLGVKGTDDEIKQAVGDFGGHALALTLLGTYLSTVYKGDVRKRDRIAKLTREKKYGGRAVQVMESYEKWFKGKPELDILCMMGLFDSPAEGGAIEVLRAEPPIKGLTSELKNLSDDDWCFALDNLRKAGLLAKEDPHEPDALDCHPLIREHFGEKLRNNNPDAWKEAHSRLYKYYESQVKEPSDTVEEMVPLFKLVSHGCRAGRYQEADKDYFFRIRRGDDAFNIHKLGAFGASLASISGFFEKPWDKPVSELTEDQKSFYLNEAGIILRALGKLKEAAQHMKAGLEFSLAQKDSKNIAIISSNLSELYLTLGDFDHAMDYAKQSVDEYGEIFCLTTLADTLHQAGIIEQAESLFQKAEEMQNRFLYSTNGFKYCDLLLEQGKYNEVLDRAKQTIEIAETKEEGSLLDVALNHLLLGRSYLIQARHEDTGDFSQAERHLNMAVDGLRRARTLHELPRGLLARAELYIAQKDFEKAKRDLDEVATIAERGEMGLHKADCRLGYARLYLALGDKEKAREELAAAKEMIGKMGYHRRDGEVKELEERLKL